MGRCFFARAVVGFTSGIGAVRPAQVEGASRPAAKQQQRWTVVFLRCRPDPVAGRAGDEAGARTVPWMQASGALLGRPLQDRESACPLRNCSSAAVRSHGSGSDFVAAAREWCRDPRRPHLPAAPSGCSALVAHGWRILFWAPGAC